LFYENLINECGYSEDPEDLYIELKQLTQNINNLPSCVEDLVIQDRISFIQTEYCESITENELFEFFGQNIIENNIPCESIYDDIDFGYSELYQDPDRGEEISNLSLLLDCFNTTQNSNCSHKVTLYVDQPVANSNTPYHNVGGNKKDVGHTFIGVEQTCGTVTKRVIFGFYPWGDPVPITTPTLPGLIRNDEEHSYDVSVTWNLSDLHFNNFINATKNYYTNIPDYDLNHRNCSTTACYLLNQIGSGVPENIVSWPGGAGINPGQLGQDLRNMTLQTWMTRSTTTAHATEDILCF